MLGELLTSFLLTAAYLHTLADSQGGNATDACDVCQRMYWVSKLFVRTYFVSAALLAVVRDCANIIMIEYVCMHIFLYIDYRI